MENAKMTREERTKIFDETVNIVKEGRYISPIMDEEIIIQDEDRMIEETVFYGKKAEVDFPSLNRYDTHIEVVNQDCLLAARDLEMKGRRTAVLNMASFQTPGGGVTRGSGAQEENLFRRTNLFRSLFQFHYIGDNYGVKQKEERYPLDYNFGAIYTPYVTVFRDTEENCYQLLEDPFSIAVISVAAVKNPPLKEDGTLQPWVVTTLKNKVRQIFSVALQHGHTSIVLSAFGCGAYKTPPTQMAKIFDDVLKENNFKGAFEDVIFAIIDDGNSYNASKVGNFQPFKEIFGRQG